MNLKTALFITLFLCVLALTNQATVDSGADTATINDNQDATSDVNANKANLFSQAVDAERKVVADLKRQAKVAKEEFKAAFKKLKTTLTPASGDSKDSSDSSDSSDTVIQQAITQAENVADQVKQGDWKAVSELKAKATSAKTLYQSAKDILKEKISRSKGTADSSDSSDSTDSSDDEGSVVEKAKTAAEWKIISELKGQAKRAQEAAKQAYKKFRKIDAVDDNSSSSSSDSSDSSDSAVKEGLKEKVKETVEEHASEAAKTAAAEGAQSLLEQAKQAQKAVYEELKGGAQRAKDAFKTAYRDLKNKIRAEKDTQTSTGDNANAGGENRVDNDL